jgi:hypothetical protein
LDEDLGPKSLRQIIISKISVYLKMSSKAFSKIYKYQLSRLKLKKYSGKSIGEAYNSILKDSKEKYPDMIADIKSYDKSFKKHMKDSGIALKDLTLKSHSKISSLIVAGIKHESTKSPKQSPKYSPKYSPKHSPKPIKSFEDKIQSILSFINESSHEKIIEDLVKTIEYNNFCPVILGQGVFGRAYSPTLDNTVTFAITKKKSIKIPIVIKESHNSKDSTFTTKVLDDKLYISGFINMTTEALILMFIRKLYNKTVHLPLILGYGTCQDSSSVNRIITMKYGLEAPVEIDLTDRIFSYFTEDYPIKFTSHLNTVKELLEFIYFSKKPDGSVILPNGIICPNVSELFDYITISYLATHLMLTKNGIYPADMHGRNIFIHWFDQNSYFNTNKLKNVKEIVYKVGTKYYKIKTFGFVIILGDTGIFKINVKKDIIIVGQSGDLDGAYKSLERIMTPEFGVFDFIALNIRDLTTKDCNQTITSRIINSYPYDSYENIMGVEKSYIDKLKTPEELLGFYDKKYGVKEYMKNPDNILIKV